MAKKKRKNKTTEISIRIELPEQVEPEPSSVDVFAHHFLTTLSYWIFGFIGIAIIGSCAAIL